MTRVLARYDDDRTFTMRRQPGGPVTARMACSKQATGSEGWIRGDGWLGGLVGWETNGEDGVGRRGGEEVSADSGREHAGAHKTGVGGFMAAAPAGYESDFGEGATWHVRTEDDLHLGMQQRGTGDGAAGLRLASWHV